VRRSLTARMAIAGAALAVAFGAVFALLLHGIGDLRDSSRAARDTAGALALATRAEKLVLDVETSQRGFLIARQERFLEPLRAARRGLPGQLDRLVAGEAGDPDHQPVAREIRRAALAYLNGYANDIVRLVRRDPARAQRIVASGAGKRRVDAIRRLFDRFRALESAESADRIEDADGAARRAIALGAGGLVVSVALIALFTASLARIVVAPVRGIARAVGRLAGGDLTVRLPERGAAEVGQLARAFNEMAASLEESRDELESQNDELARQAAELEEHHEALTSANDELRAQHDELERTGAQLAEEVHAVETFEALGRQLATARQPERVAEVALERVLAEARADAGSFYAGYVRSELRLLAATGVARERLPAARGRDEGAAGRAMAAGRPVPTDLGDEGVRVAGVAGDVVLRHELHLPVRHGDEVEGVLSLGWSSRQAALDADVDVLARLAARAGPNLAGAFALEAVRRLADVNRTVIEAVRDAVALTDREGKVVLANRRTRELTEALVGVDAESALADMEAFAPLMTDPEGYVAATRRIAADPPEPTFDEYELAEAGRTFERYTVPVEGETGRLGRLMVFREVTRERQADNAKANLMAAVSHELRTPLASILGYTELIVERDPDAERRREYLAAIQSAGRRLEALIDDLLDLRRIEEGTAEAPRDAMALDDLLREQVELFRGQSRSHALELELPDGALVVRGARDELIRVVANLLSNAIKYSPNGGRVTVRATRDNGFAAVSVSDEGIGIPPEQREAVFERFARVDSSDTRTIGGTGLGLALAREIVHLHGGQIGFDSVLGRGSTFRFTVPLAER
jgi:signal transduction histidine kinase/CHASE3 domain sensor protein